MNWLKALWKNLTRSAHTQARCDWGKELQNFTPRACKVMQLAEKEALRLNHPFVGTEHLLIGLLEIRDQGVAQGVLKKCGVQPQAVCYEVERIDGRGPDSPVKLILPTPRLKKVFNLAREESGELGHTYIGTEHLLLAMLREGRGVGARTLRQLNVDLHRIVQEIRREIAPNCGSA